MSDIVQLLQKIRQRPGMYIGWPSLSRLAGFLHGYTCATFELRGTDCDAFFITFQEWIEKRLQVKHDFWENAILQRTASEEKAFDLFWELLDEYLTEHGPQVNGAVAASHSATKELQP